MLESNVLYTVKYIYIYVPTYNIIYDGHGRRGSLIINECTQNSFRSSTVSQDLKH